MGVHAPDPKLLGMAAEVSSADEGSEVALRIEVLDACGLDQLDGVLTEAGSLAGAEKAGFRSAMTVFGQVVYAASGLTTQNPVRLGGLPHGTDLAIAVLPPASASSADVPLLATAPLALGMMRACGKPVSPQDGWPAGALIWEGWLPLSLCGKEGIGLTEGAFGDARIQVSVLLEEPEQLSLDVTQLVPRTSEPQPTTSSLGSCLSSPLRSDDNSEAMPTSHMEKAQSFRLEKTLMSEVSAEAQPARPARSPPRGSLPAAGTPKAYAPSQETALIESPLLTSESAGSAMQPTCQASIQQTATNSPLLGPAVSQTPARATAELVAGTCRTPPAVEGPRVQLTSRGPLAASVPVALSVVAPASSRSAPGIAAAGPQSPASASPGRQHRGGGSAVSSVSSRPAVPSEAVLAERISVVPSTAEASSAGSSTGGSAARESELQLENSRLRAELESSRQDVELLRHRREEDHQHVQEKLRELEVEVRSRWQKRVSELEAEVATLKQLLAAGSSTAALNASTLSLDTDSHNVSQVQQTATVAAYPSPAYLPTVGGVGRCGGGPAGHHSATPTPLLQWAEFNDPSVEGPLLEGPRLGLPGHENCLQTPVRMSSSPSAFGKSPTLDSAPSLGSPEPAWPTPQLGPSMVPGAGPFRGASLQSPTSGGMMGGSFHGTGQRVNLDAAGTAGSIKAPGGLLPPPGLKVQGLGPVNLQQIDFLERNPLPRYPDSADDAAGATVSDSAWPASSAQASMSAMCGGVAPSGGMMTTPAKRRDSRPPSPPRPSAPQPASRPSPTKDVSAIPVSVEHASSSLCTAPSTARATSPEWREQDIRNINLRNDPSVLLKHRSQSVPIMARPSISPGQADEKGLLGFFEAFGGLYTQLVQGTKCTGPDALAVNERLVEIDLSAEFPPERRAAQVDLLAQPINHNHSKTRMFS